MKSNGLVNNNSITENNNHGLTAGDVRPDDTKMANNEEDDLFSCGPPVRNYGTSFCGRPNRPTMISAKYRQKEERRKVLKISINKLKKIEDPESSLRRSVLINNTMKRLQREAREEKLQKQSSVTSFRCSFDFIKEEEKSVGLGVGGGVKEVSCQLADITNLPEELVSRKELGCEESLGSESCVPARRDSRKRSVEELDDTEDVHAVLSQFYMPLTPRMLTSIDEDEEEIVNVVDVDTPAKKSRLDTPPPSCAHSSIFTDLQPVVYHSLIASLET